MTPQVEKGANRDWGQPKKVRVVECLKCKKAISPIQGGAVRNSENRQNTTLGRYSNNETRDDDNEFTKSMDNNMLKEEAREPHGIQDEVARILRTYPLIRPRPTTTEWDGARGTGGLLVATCLQHTHTTC